ncbi:GntR family transcriptional regulator [Rhodovastum atsumiense]|uniref:GntR family transcriptional regulator n=1 Tax=Rhodovastum atsumiense TaxID=504468 RepID=A0A5M6J0L0_9PROT|nr:GntR family transcriptional regulator [Rhodovastum atsumiense]KAA5614103.1 GntR family transcriptional regulator [Rhodovastum atsumiense]CAH2598945.1 GntR family transcriptional regulator [Rhodovastum atsumiense]
MNDPSSHGLGVVQRVTVVEAVTDALRARILSAELPEGAQLRQETLAAELGVSRIPLREAFRRLESEGLVTIMPHRGAIVSVLSLDDIAELFDLRAMLEPELVRRAIPHQTELTLARAEHILADYAAALERSDVAAWGTLNSQFHLALYEPSGRARSLALVHGLLDQTDRYTRMQLLFTGGRGQSRARQEHAALLQACKAGDAVQAGELLAAHVRDAGDSLLAFLRTWRRRES